MLASESPPGEPVCRRPWQYVPAVLLAVPFAAAAEEAPPAPGRGPRSLGSALGRGVLCGLLLCLAVEVGNHLLARNLHAVIPGAVYRSAQPSGADVEWLVRAYGIRTIINVRGFRDSQEWYRDECRAAHRLNVSVEDVGLSAGHLPPVGEMRRLVELLDRSEYPVLFHCFRGVDRTGLASVVALLLKTDLPLDEARRDLSLRYLHLPWGRTGNLDRFFDLYEEWLRQRGCEHAPATFRAWVAGGYRGGACRCRLELLSPLVAGVRAAPLNGGALPWLDDPPAVREMTSAGLLPRRLCVPRGVPFGLRLRCHNTSARTWRLHPDLTAGVHAVWTLMDDAGRGLLGGRSGMFHAEVAPGSSVDLTLALPPIGRPGRYTLQIDMIEEQHCFFRQAGSDVVEVGLEVP